MADEDRRLTDLFREAMEEMEDDDALDPERDLTFDHPEPRFESDSDE